MLATSELLLLNKMTTLLRIKMYRISNKKIQEKNVNAHVTITLMGKILEYIDLFNIIVGQYWHGLLKSVHVWNNDVN